MKDELTGKPNGSCAGAEAKAEELDDDDPPKKGSLPLPNPLGAADEAEEVEDGTPPKGSLHWKTVREEGKRKHVR